MLEILEDRTLLSGLNLVSQNLFGGSGNEVGTGIAAVDTGSGYAVYTSGRSDANGNEGLLVKYDVPYGLTGAAQEWSTTWPGRAGADSFNGVAANSNAVYAAGYSYSQTTDTVGDKEQKGITVSFPAAGGNSAWATQTPAAPGAFSYGGYESLNAVTASVEGGQTVLYATGTAQSGFFNGGRLFVSKLDAAGNVLWTETDPSGTPQTDGLAITAAGGKVYVAGFTDDSGTTTTYLKSYDQNGTLLWTQTSASGLLNGLVVDASTGSIYAVGRTNGTNADFLIEKWDTSGNLVWSQTYDRSGGNDILNGVTLLNGRLYAAGSTTGATAGGSDGVVLEIDPATGSLLDTTLWGGAADDSFQGIAATPTALHLVATTNSFGSGGSDMAYVLYSAATNQSPVLDPISDKTVDVGSVLSFSAHATDADGDSLTYSVDAGAPAGASINPSTGVFTFQPTSGPATYSVTVRVTDNGSPSLSDTETFTIFVKATPAFSMLSSPTVIVGTPSTTLSGKISFGSAVPTGNVTITLNGVSESATINPDGTFAASFATGALGLGAYPISYSYGGDALFNSTTGEGTLDVTYNVTALFDTTHPKQAGSTIPIQIQLTDAAGQNVSSPNTTVTALGIASINSPDNLLPADPPGDSFPDNLFKYSSGGRYQYDLKTPKSLAPGTYLFYFMIEGDPLVHSVEFEVK